MTITNLLEGRVVITRANSGINGELTVVRDLAFGTYIRGGGLPQSGGLAEKIWKDTLRKIKDSKLEIKNCLIVGLGGGSIAKLVRKNWPVSRGEPEVKITGVDIDPVIVELGKKYLKLDKSNVDIRIQDAEEFIRKQAKKEAKFDLICFDTYVGESFPEKFESAAFIKQVSGLLSENGVVIFNRLYGPAERDSAIEFEKTLNKVFSKVDRVYPEANIMFVCSQRSGK